MKNRKDNKRKASFLAVLLLLVFVGIGYAALTATLNINGTANVISQTWDVHFGTPSAVTTVGDAATVTAPAVSKVSDAANPYADNNLLTFTASFKKPGDSYSFTVPVENTGSLDADVYLEVTSLTGTAAKYLTWTVEGITTTTTGEKLAATTGSKDLTVTVSMNNLTELPTTAEIAELTNVQLRAIVHATQSTKQGAGA